MQKILGASVFIFTLIFVRFAIAQVSQSSDSFSHLNRPAPPQGTQMSPQATAEAAKQRIEADKKAGRVPEAHGRPEVSGDMDRKDTR